MEVLIILSIMFLILFVFGLLALFNKKLPKWFCDKLQWHLPPISKDFNGHTYYGKCPRCKRFIFLNSSGVWNEIHIKSKRKI